MKFAYPLIGIALVLMVSIHSYQFTFTQDLPEYCHVTLYVTKGDETTQSLEKIPLESGTQLSLNTNAQRMAFEVGIQFGEQWATLIPSAIAGYHANAHIHIQQADPATLAKHKITPQEGRLYIHITAAKPGRSHRFLEENIYAFDVNKTEQELLFIEPQPAPPCI